MPLKCYVLFISLVIKQIDVISASASSTNNARITVELWDRFQRPISLIDWGVTVRLNCSCTSATSNYVAILAPSRKPLVQSTKDGELYATYKGLIDRSTEFGHYACQCDGKYSDQDFMLQYQMCDPEESANFASLCPGSLLNRAFKSCIRSLIYNTGNFTYCAPLTHSTCTDTHRYQAVFGSDVCVGRTYYKTLCHLVAEYEQRSHEAFPAYVESQPEICESGLIESSGLQLWDEHGTRECPNNITHKDSNIVRLRQDSILVCLYYRLVSSIIFTVYNADPFYITSTWHASSKLAISSGIISHSVQSLHSFACGLITAQVSIHDNGNMHKATFVAPFFKNNLHLRINTSTDCQKADLVRCDIAEKPGPYFFINMNWIFDRERFVFNEATGKFPTTLLLNPLESGRYICLVNSTFYPINLLEKRSTKERLPYDMGAECAALRLAAYGKLGIGEYFVAYVYVIIAFLIAIFLAVVIIGLVAMRDKIKINKKGLTRTESAPSESSGSATKRGRNARKPEERNKRKRSSKSSEDSS